MADEPEEIAEVAEGAPPEDTVVEVRETEADQQRGGKKPAAEAAPPAPESPAAGLEEMHRQLREAEARTAALEQAARRMQGERDQAMALAQEAEKRGISAQELMIEDQIKATVEQRKTLVEQLTSAQTDGDYAKGAQIIEKMQDLAVSHGFLNEKKMWLAQQRELRKQPPPKPQPSATEVPSGDDFETKVRSSYSPAAASFLLKHRDLLRSDGTLKRRALDLHEAALDQGYTADSPGYYEYVEKLLAPEPPSEHTTGNGAAGAAITAPPPAPRGTAAPVSRGNVRVPGGGGKQQPTPTMRRLAQEQGVPIDDWMAHYERLLSQGRITPVR